MSTRVPISSDVPPRVLEQEAIAQRQRIHESVRELREQVRGTVREKLDVRRRAREYVWPATGVAFLLSFVVGYGTAGTVKHMIS